MPPFFSIIIPSFLGNYSGAAKNRESKIFRALDSAFQQTFKNIEVIFVADGCDKSYDLITSHYNDERLRAYLIPKQPRFSGNVRNFAISKAKGEWVIYLDIDDFLGLSHAENIARAVLQENAPTWAFFDDKIGTKKGAFTVRNCSPTQRYACGTSNIAHRRDAAVTWGDGYLHDWQFIQRLLVFQYITISGGEYHVCHVPNFIDI